MDTERLLPRRIVSGIDVEQPMHEPNQNGHGTIRAVCGRRYDDQDLAPQPMLLAASCFDIDDAMTDRLQRFIKTYRLPVDGAPHERLIDTRPSALVALAGETDEQRIQRLKVEKEREILPMEPSFILWQYTSSDS